MTGIVHADVSVIVPVFRGSRFLPLALGSLRAQTVPPREVIVVDDGSDDGSGEVAARIGRGLPCEFSVLRQENRGLSAAMNAGLARARAGWVLELDADDYLVPEAVEAFSSRARGGIDVVSSHFDTFRFRSPAWLRRLAVRRVRWPLPDTESQRRVNTIITTSLARRSKVVECGGWEERLRRHQDWDLWLRMWSGTNFDKVAAALVKVYRHASSMSADHAGMLRHSEMVRAHWRTRYAGVPDSEM